MQREVAVIQIVRIAVTSRSAAGSRFIDRKALSVRIQASRRVFRRQRRIIAGDIVPARVDPDAFSRHVIHDINVRRIQSVCRAVHVEHISVIRTCALQREVAVIQIVRIAVTSRAAAGNRFIDRKALSVRIQASRRVFRRQRLIITRNGDPIRRNALAFTRHKIRHNNDGYIRAVFRASHVALRHIIRIDSKRIKSDIIQIVGHRILSRTAGDRRFGYDESARVTA